MGTEFKVTIWPGEAEPAEANRILGEVLDELGRLEKQISSWLPDSETSRLNRAAGWESVPVSKEMDQLLRRSRHWSEKTGGAFDITGGPLFELWEEARSRGLPPSQGEIDQRRALVGMENVRVENGNARLEAAGMKIGFGAIGKGFAADRAADFLEARGITNFLIDAGGDVLARGNNGDRPWHVAIRDPRRKGSFLAGFEAVDCAIATSGDYERYFELNGKRYSHLLDLRTGRPGGSRASVTVIARSAADADALATALFIMKPEEGIALVESLPEMDAILVDQSGSRRLSSGLTMSGDKLTVGWQ